MKIGITCYPTVGGSGVVATELGKLLAENGHEVHFISTALPFRLTKPYPNIYYHEVEVNEYEVFQYPPYSLTLASKMAEVIKEEKLDVLHVHYAIPHAVCALLAKDMVNGNIKVVTTLHGTDITVLGHDLSLREIIRYAIERSDEVTAVSEALVKETQAMLDISRPIKTIYNFIDERAYYPHEGDNSLKEAYGITEEEKVVIHISNFRPVKRVLDVIEAFAALKKDCNAVLLMIGDGPDRLKACKRAEELGISEHVLFLGNQKNITDYLHIADLMLLLSDKESFGLAALEAMACGVPVIGSDAGGIPEVVSHGMNGYIVPVGAPEQAGETGAKLLNDEAMYKSFSEHAESCAKTTFGFKKVLKQYEEVYENA